MTTDVLHIPNFRRVPPLLVFLSSHTQSHSSFATHTPPFAGARKQNPILPGIGTARNGEQHDAGADREQWLSPPVYPHATKQFYEMFENDDSQYDGVYAMLASPVLRIVDLFLKTFPP